MDHKSAGQWVFSDSRLGAEKIQLISDILNAKTDVRLRVTGESMRPFLKAGSIVTLRREPLEKLRIGDLILCRSHGNAMILHRLIGFDRKKGRKRDRSFLVTKGDALDAPDQPTPAGDYLARVIQIASGNGALKACRSMDSLPAWAGNYIQAVYHRFRSRLICSYMKTNK